MLPARISTAAIALLAVSGLTGCAIFDAHRAPQAEHSQRAAKSKSKTHHYAKTSTAASPRVYKMKRKAAATARAAAVATSLPFAQPASARSALAAQSIQAPASATRSPPSSVERVPGTTLSSAPIPSAAAPSTPAPRPALPSVAAVQPATQPAPPPRVTVPAAAIEAARKLFLSGEVVKARAEFQGMISSGDPSPVLELARTYDPHYLMQTRGRDASADVTRARTLYQEAAKKGSAAAAADMARLGPAH